MAKSRLEQLRALGGNPDPILTNLSRGYTNAEFVGEKLFPIIGNKKEGARIPKFGKEMFNVYDSLRALRAKSNRIEGISSDFVPIKLEEHDLMYPLDYRELKEAEGNGFPTPLEKHANNRTNEGLRLGLEKLQADKAQDADNYPVGHVETLGSGDKIDNDDSDPIELIEDAKATVRSAIAKEPNVMVIDYETLRKLKRHPKLRGLVGVTQGVGAVGGLVTDEMLKVIFGIDNIFVGKSVYLNPDPSSQDLVDLWNQCIVLAYTSTLPTDQRTEYDSSFGYTFRKEGHPYSDVFEDEGGKVINQRTTDNYCVEILGPDAGYLIKDTLSI